MASTLSVILTDTATTASAAVVVAEYIRRVGKRHEQRLEQIARQAVSSLVGALDQRIERIERIIEASERRQRGRWP